MKSSLLFLIALMLSLPCYVHAQNSSPNGMRYQAIARDLDGNIRNNESLALKVELLTIGDEIKVVYTELHDVKSGVYGLLNLTIGEGIDNIGRFSEIPWSQQNVWVRISIKDDKNQDYQEITTSKFYSVPYAFYAEKAGTVETKPNGKDEDRNNRNLGEGSNGSNWSLDGNVNSNARNDGNPILGTTDNNHLKIVTNNLPRLVIAETGESNFTGDVDMDGSLNVDNSVTLNTSGGTTTINGNTTVANGSQTDLTGTLQVDGLTTLNSDLTVTNMSPTHLTGSLDVDKDLNVDGATNLNNGLNVNNGSPTVLSGSLDVGLGISTNDALTVGNMSPTHLTGTLDVDKDLNVDGSSTLNGSLDVTGMNPTNLSGELTVGKATTLESSLSVMNMAPTHLTGSLAVDKSLVVTDATTLNGSLDVTSGSTNLSGPVTIDGETTMNAGLTVSGAGTLGPNGEHIAFFDNTSGGQGDGVGIRIQKDNTTAANNFATFYKGDDEVAGRIEGYVLNDLLSPPLPTDDEIWTAVCIIIADYNPVTLMWTQFASKFNLFGTIWNGATIPSFDLPDFPGLELPDFPGLVLPDFQGQNLPDFPGVPLPTFGGVNLPNISSVSVAGTEVFPGLSLPNIPSFNIPDIPGFVVPNIPGFAVPDIPPFVIPDIPAFEIPRVPEINLSSDLFEVPVIPTFSDILMDLGVCPDEDIFAVPDGYVFRLIEWGVQNDMQNMISFDPVDLAAKTLIWGVTKVVKAGGVTYGSKGADYAEYLEKQYENEMFVHGEVVGVRGGKISKNTNGADQILAISTNPLVLGNTPHEDQVENFEKVGFLGQVPVFVEGPVQMGDYIVPSGNNDGIGIAISPQDITADNLSNILGKAWSASSLNVASIINVSIGLRPTEIAEVLKKREAKLIDLQKQISEQDKIHGQLKADVNLLKAHLGIEGLTTQKSN